MEGRRWELEEGEIEEIEVEDDTAVIRPRRKSPTSSTEQQAAAAASEIDQKPSVMPYPVALMAMNRPLVDESSEHLIAPGGCPQQLQLSNIVKICSSDGSGRPLALFKSSTLMDGGLDLVDMLAQKQQLDDGERWERDFKEYRREQEERNLREKTKKNIRSFISPTSSKVKLESGTSPSSKKAKHDNDDGRSNLPIVSDVASLADYEWVERPAVVAVASAAPAKSSPAPSVKNPSSMEELKELADRMVNFARKERGLPYSPPRTRRIEECPKDEKTLEAEVDALRDELLMSLWRDTWADQCNAKACNDNNNDEEEKKHDTSADKNDDEQDTKPDKNDDINDTRADSSMNNNDESLVVHAGDSSNDTSSLEDDFDIILID